MEFNLLAEYMIESFYDNHQNELCLVKLASPWRFKHHATQFAIFKQSFKLFRFAAKFQS